MSEKSSIIESLRKIAGDANVFTDPEDLYVYSFEQLFSEKKRYPKLDAVLRVTSEDQIDDVLRLVSKEDIALYRRSAENAEAQEASSSFTVLLDDVAAPQLHAFPETKGRGVQDEFKEEISRTGYGSVRNFSLGLKSFFSGLPAQKCLNVGDSSSFCTVSSSFNGVETWSSKGRTLLTRALSSGELPPSPKLIDVLYTCSLCGLCFADCFESTQVRKAIMDARNRIVKNGFTPELFTAAAKNILKVGDPSGTLPSKRVAWTERLHRKRGFPEMANVLYWVGCTTSTRTPNVAVAFHNLLTRAGIDFTFLDEKEGCCGYVLLATGMWKEAKENALAMIERIKATRVENLVTTCSGCYYTFSKMYPEMLNIELPCQVLHSTQYMEGLIREGKIIPHGLDMKVTYHDPCSLGRHSNVYQSPRNIMKAVPSLDLVEMPLIRNSSRCCGAGGGLWSFNNSVATNSAVERLVKDVVPIGVSALVTACPTCHINLRNASVRESLGIKVYDLMEILDSASVAQVSKA